MNIMLVEEHSAPYRDETLQEMVGRTGANLFILAAEKKCNGHSEWNYASPLEDCRQYSSKVINTKIGAYRKGFYQMLKKVKPSVLITSSPLEGLIAKNILHCRIVLRADTIKIGRHGNQKWNRAVLKWLYSIGDAMWVAGRASERYFSMYLKGRRPIYQGTYTNDVRKQYAAILRERERRVSLRKEFSFDNSDFIFLFIGKLIPTRHINVLLQAMERCELESLPIKAIIVGNGEEENAVLEYCERHKNVKHIPSAPICDMEKYYAIADGYVHPGEEPYSLALYEAAVAGLPILSSDKVGAVEDCVKSGANGYLYAFCNVEMLFEYMKKVSVGLLKPEGTTEMQKFILESRGITWAAAELMKACAMGNGE